MSGYEHKSQEPSVYDYATTRSSQAPSYAAFAPPSFSPQYSSTQATEPHALPSSHQMPFLDSPFEPRDTGYQTTPTPLIPARSRTSPETTSAGAFSGRPGEKFRIDHRSARDYPLHQTTFSLIFGSVTCKATVTAKSHHDDSYVYSVTVDVPPFPPTETRRNMPLLLDIRDENGIVQDIGNYGTFEYLATSAFQPYSQLPAPIESRKRKLGEEATAYVQPVLKRAASQPIQPRYTSAAMSPSMQAPLAGPSQYFDPNIRYALPSGGYDRPAAPQRMYGAPLSHSPTYGYGPGPVLQQAKVRSPSATAQSFYSTVRPITSPRFPRTARISSAHRGGSPSGQTQPTLVRTSILQQGSTASVQRGFNPYANYPDGKAQLVLQGDLMSMIENWTPEEQELRRRLVEFNRSQTGSVVTATFKAVTLENRTPNGACLSCIWWEERNDYYVTSVDTISLLESLIAARFTVEEKNRIRRNLEGLKPITVSKLNHDTESFYRLIMSFPNPKPRNIEKDVKVFHWAQLETALTKIFGKYSASFSSTASHLLPPAHTSAGVEASGDQHPTASPRSTTGSTASVSYASGMTSTALSPPITGSAGLRQHGMGQEEGSSALVGTTVSMANVTPEEYRTSAYGMGQMMSGPAYSHYQPQYSPPAAQEYPVGYSSARPGYGMTPYLEPGASSTLSAYAQPLEYYRGDQASEQATAFDAKPSYSPRQPTTSG